MIEINYIGVIAAAVVAVVLGFLWYGPVFGKPWMKEMGFTKASMDAAKKKGMTKSYVLMLVSALVMAYVLAHVIAFSANEMGGMSVMSGIQGGFWTWLGFVATVLLGQVMWENKSLKLYALNAGYYLVSLMAMGAVIAMIG